MGSPDAERVQDRECVRGHVGDGVRVRGEVDGGGPADVPVVVADHSAAPVDQAPEHAVVPLDALRLRAHHQQHHRRPRRPEVLGPEVQFAHRDGALAADEGLVLRFISLHGDAG